MDPTEADAAYDAGGYVKCSKCGVEHSTLVKHTCFKPTKQKKKPKFDDADKVEGESGGGGDGAGGDGGGNADGDRDESQNQGDNGQGDGSDGDGDGDDGSDGSDDGDGKDGSDGQKGKKGKKGKKGDEGDEGDGSSGRGSSGEEGDEEEEGDGGESGQEAPVPQAPEPETPPVVVVVSVLKFAALTAQCAKNGNIEITLAEDGLFVYGHNGDTVAFDVIPWGELENRATIDGQFYVKGVIDGVDKRLVDARKEMIAKVAAIPEKPEEKPEAEKPKTIFPLVKGQRVEDRRGRQGIVLDGEKSLAHSSGQTLTCVNIKFDDGTAWYIRADNGQFWRANFDNPKEHERDIIDKHIAVPKSKRTKKGKITLPLMIGQKVQCKDGLTREVVALEPSIFRESKGRIIAHFDDGVVVWAETGTVEDDGQNGVNSKNLGSGEIYNTVADVYLPDEAR